MLCPNDGRPTRAGMIATALLGWVDGQRRPPPAER
jgi:hypothetical protein